MMRVEALTEECLSSGGATGCASSPSWGVEREGVSPRLGLTVVLVTAGVAKPRVPIGAVDVVDRAAFGTVDLGLVDHAARLGSRILDVDVGHYYPFL